MDAPRPTHDGLTCPACRWEWQDVPRPVPVLGYQPLSYTCPNRRCKQRHWIICWKLVAGARLRLRHVDTVPAIGRGPEQVRLALRQIPELDEETIEFAIAVLALRPERSGPRTGKSA